MLALSTPRRKNLQESLQRPDRWRRWSYLRHGGAVDGTIVAVMVGGDALVGMEPGFTGQRSLICSEYRDEMTELLG
jgi:hypothetical protein